MTPHTKATLASIMLVSISLSVLLLVLNQEPPKEEQLFCTLNESLFIENDGWTRMSTADFRRFSDPRMKAKDKPEIRYMPGTLICTVWIDGKPHPDTRGGLLYWRKL